MEQDPMKRTCGHGADATPISQDQFAHGMARYHQLIAELTEELGDRAIASDAALQAALAHAASHSLHDGARAKLHEVVDGYFDQVAALRARRADA